jgi:uncharacterized phage protein (TIGR01671 family)
MIKKNKFAFWHKKRKEMWSVESINWQTKEVSNGGDVASLDDGDLLQFTGLLDKNGKEIFEGDLISTPHFFNWTITGYEKRKVFFKDGAFGVKENEHNFIALKSLFKGVESSKAYISNYGEVYREFEPVFEVIGNIYENPELIGGENE